MHELSLLLPVLERVRAEMKKEKISHLTRINLKVGDLHEIVPEIMEFNFQAAIAGTELENAELVIQSIPLLLVCRVCEKESAGIPRLLQCGQCGSGDVKIRKGRELLIESIEW